MERELILSALLMERGARRTNFRCLMNGKKETEFKLVLRTKWMELVQRELM